MVTSLQVPILTLLYPGKSRELLVIKVLRIYIISSVIKVIDKWVTFKLEKVRNMSAGVFCEGTDNLGRKEQLINDLSEHVKRVIPAYLPILNPFLANNKWRLLRLLITFANSLHPDQNRHSVGPDLDPNHLTL